LHNPANEKRAIKALEDYNKVDPSSLIQTGRELSAQLVKDEFAIKQELLDTLVEADLFLVIGSSPNVRDPTNPGGKLGWNKLKSETDKALQNVENLGILRDLQSYKHDLKLANQVYQRSVDLYMRGSKPGTHETDCFKIDIEVVENRTGPPENEPPNKWHDIYIPLVIPNCKDLKDAKQLFDVMRSIVLTGSGNLKQIAALKSELQETEEKEKELKKEFAKANKKFAKAQAELAELTVEKQTEKAKEKVDELIGYARKLEEVVKKADKFNEKFDILGAEFRADFLEALLPLTGYLTGNTENEVAKNYQQFSKRRSAGDNRQFQSCSETPGRCLASFSRDSKTRI